MSPGPCLSPVYVRQGRDGVRGKRKKRAIGET